MAIIDKQPKVRTTIHYLTDVAMLWWRKRYSDISKGIWSIKNFDDFKQELKWQFYLKNIEEEARDQLCHLKQFISLRNYIKEFMGLVLVTRICCSSWTSSKVGKN